MRDSGARRIADTKGLHGVGNPEARLLSEGEAWSIAALSPGTGYADAVAVRDGVLTCSSINIPSLHEV